MGTFRVILAIAVMLSHITTTLGASIVNRESLHILIWSGQAVFAFFIISGFYMSLIINEKYAKLPNGTSRYYLNRALRLYPVHWMVLAMYIAGALVTSTPYFLTGGFMDPLGRWLYAVVANVFLVGVEIPVLINVDNGRFMTGPIWSLSLECYFYLMAPFIVGRSIRTLALLAVVALALRLSLYFAGLPVHPWRYFFFPSVLVFFLMGSLCYHAYVWVRDKPYARRLGIAAALLLAVCTVTPALWTASDLDQPVAWLFYALVWIATPLLFNLSKRSRLDNLLGQLSYPIYLSHVLVIVGVKRIDTFGIDKGLVATVGTLALSVCLYVFIDRPIEPFRRRIGAA
jgi:peptidoglycan/LPS O-acetylase OafA/YrhL